MAIRVDLRGHGASPTAPPALALADYAEDVHALLTRLRCAPAAVVGFSFGGMLAQVVALTYPQDVNALVISACPSTLSDEGRAVVAGRGAQAERRGMAVNGNVKGTTKPELGAVYVTGGNPGHEMVVVQYIPATAKPKRERKSPKTTEVSK